MSPDQSSPPPRLQPPRVRGQASSSSSRTRGVHACLSALWLSLLLLCCSPLASSGNFFLNLVYSIDIRGRMLPIDSYQNDCAPAAVAPTNRPDCFGGMARRFDFVQQNRANFTNTLAVDVGNLFYGTSFQVVANPAGSNIAQWVSAASPSQNYDVISLGTNEFFNGPGTLTGYLGSMLGSKPVVVSSNLFFADPSLGTKVHKYSVHNFNGTRVAVIGAISTQLATTSSPGPDVIVAADTVAALNEVIAEIVRDELPVKIIVLLSTLSTTAEISLVARTVQYLDVILYRSVDDNEALAQIVTSAFGLPVVMSTSPNVGGPSAFGGSMGRLQAMFDDQGNLLYANDTQMALGAAYPDDPTMWTEISSEYVKVAALDGKQVSVLTQDYGEAALTAADPWIWCRQVDCNLGKLVTQTMLDWCPDCSIAHINGGGLRINLYRNIRNDSILTRGDILKMLPFGNNFVSYSILGKDFLSTMLNFALTKYQNGGWHQYSGIRWAWNPVFKFIVFVSIYDRALGIWAPLDPTRVYKIATINFIFAAGNGGGGDGYAIGPLLSFNPFGPPSVDALSAYMNSTRFETPPSLEDLRVCGINTSYTLVDPTGTGNLTWPFAQCTVLQTYATTNLADQCPTNYPLCISTTEAYEGKAVNQSNCNSCSGLGSCITNFRRCACDRPTTSGLFAGITMIQGSDCSLVRTEYSFNPSLIGFLYALSAVTIAITGLVSLFFYVHREAKVIKRAAVFFLQLACFGALLGAIACMSIISRTTDQTCQISNWLGNMGFVLLFGSLFIKTWRIYTIFGNKRLKTVVLTDRAMLTRLGVFVTLEIILRCVEVGVTPIRMVAKQIGNCAPTQSLQDLLEGTAGNAVPDDFFYFLTCSSPNYNVIDNINWTYKACFTLWGCLLAYSIKDIQEDFNESKLLGLVIYNMTIFAVIAKVAILFLGSKDPSATLVIEILAINFVIIATMLTLAVPKYLVIRRGGPFVGGGALSKGGPGTRGGEGTGKNDSTGDFDSVLAGPLGAGLMAGTTGTTGAGGRINPVHFGKTCDVIRNRLRGSAQERNQDLAPFIEHAQRFVEQLQALRGSVSSPSGPGGRDRGQGRQSSGEPGMVPGSMSGSGGGSMANRPPHLQQVSRAINLGPARTGLTSEHRIDGEGAGGTATGGELASSPLSPTPVELNSVPGSNTGGHRQQPSGQHGHAASSRASQSQREGGLHGRHSPSPPPPPMTNNPALALLHQSGVADGGYGDSAGASAPSRSHSNSEAPAPPPMPSSLSVGGPRYNPHGDHGIVYED